MSKNKSKKRAGNNKAFKCIVEGLQHISLGLIMLDTQFNVCFINSAAKEIIHQKKRAFLTGKNFFDIVPYNSILNEHLNEAQTEQISIHLECAFFSGQYVGIDVLPFNDGLFLLFQNEIIKDKEHYFEIVNTINSISYGFYIFDIMGKLSYVNRAGEQILSKTVRQLKGRYFYDIFPELRDGFFYPTSKQRTNQYPGGVSVKNLKIGQQWFKFIGYPLENGFSVIVQDVTEHIQMGNEIARLDRLDLIGEMAACIGHEIRNPMTTVRGFLQIIREKKECQNFHMFFDLMMEELDRANQIIKEFLCLANNKAVKLQYANLNSVLQAIKPLILADAAMLDQNVILDLGRIPNVVIDLNEIRQLILNLARNGLEAMSSGQTLLVRTFIDGDQVVLSVEDEGHGIDEIIIDKIGTPFLTTKENGTGLGLAVCFKIAARHNAVIDFKTSSEGTAFFVRFPQRKIPFV